MSGRRICIMGMGPSAQERRIDMAQHVGGMELWGLNNGYLPFAHLLGGFSRWFEVHDWEYLKTWDSGAQDHFRELAKLPCPVWVQQPLPCVKDQRIVDFVTIADHFDTNYYLGSPSIMLMLALYEHDNGDTVEEIRSWGIDTSDPSHAQQRQSWAFWISKAIERGIKLTGTSTAFFLEQEKDGGLQGLAQRTGDAVQARRDSKLRGEMALDTLIADYDFDTVLDVGCGKGAASKRLTAAGKSVTALDIAAQDVDCDVFIESAFDDSIADTLGGFDAIWCAHVLEHQTDTEAFLRRLFRCAKPGAPVCITVPPAKDAIVGGHVSIWNPGLLVYNIIMAGIDCSEARVMQYGYNISVIVRNVPAELPALAYDHGDIDALAGFFPVEMREGTDGRTVITDR